MAKQAPKPFTAVPGEAQARRLSLLGSDAPAASDSGAPAQHITQRNTHIEIPQELVDMPLRDLITHSREVRMQREELDKAQKAIDEAITVRRDLIASVRDKNITAEDFDDLMNGREIAVEELNEAVE